MYPESPSILDEENVTRDERDAIRSYLPAYRAWKDQRDAAQADLDDANRAHADAVRLATGIVVDEHGAEIMQHLVNVRGAAHVVMRFSQSKVTPLAPVNVTPTIAQDARPRGAGRPKGSSQRSSALSGDSGDDDDGPPSTGQEAAR